MSFSNCYEDAARAAAYAQLEFANTYYLAYRDIPAIIKAPRPRSEDCKRVQGLYAIRAISLLRLS